MRQTTIRVRVEKKIGIMERTGRLTTFQSQVPVKKTRSSGTGCDCAEMAGTPRIVVSDESPPP